MTIPPGNLTPEKRALLHKRLQQQSVSRPAEDSIPRRPAGAPVPLSINQEGLWFIHQVAPGDANYNIPGTLRLQGRLDAAALHRALETIVARHEILHTRFQPGADQPLQVVQPPAPLPFPLHDLAHLPQPDRLAQARQLALMEARAPFDLAAGALFRAFLIRLAADDHVLVFNMHHIVSDGWSMGIFQRELTALYAAFAAGRADPLPPLPIQFGDVAVWERAALGGEGLARRLGYWQAKLDRAPPALPLPTDFPRPPVQSYRGAHETVTFHRSASAALRDFARGEGVTLFMALFAALDVLLHALTGADDLVVGTGIANRDRSELEGLIGFFVRILPLRVSLAGDPSFREALARARQVTLEANTHHLPLALLVRELQPPRDPSRNAFFQIEFTLLTPDVNPAIYGYGVSGAREQTTLGELTLSPFEIEGGVARFDLAIFLWDMPDGLTGTVEYCTDLFLPATVANFVKQYQNALQLLTSQPDIRLSEAARIIQSAEFETQEKLKQAAQASLREKFSAMRRRADKETP
jgi:hypothetical protein